MCDSLDNLSTPLYRYVKAFMINRYGRIQKTLFEDRPAIDGGLLSVTDGSNCTPEEAYTTFSAGKKNIKGVVCVTVADCQSLSLPVRHSPTVNVAHCEIDVTKMDTGKAAIALYYKAKEHGWLYPIQDKDTYFWD